MSNALKDSLSRQNATDRKNFLAVCRLSIQTLCDEAGTSGVIDDNSDYLLNFCNIIENLLCHRYHVQNKKQVGTADGIVFWEFLKLACKSVPYNCIQKINLMDNVKTTRGKGRAWIRMALMEKRLSEYFSVALMEDTVLKRFYDHGSFMLNEEAHIVANVMTALNSVDFSLCLRSHTFDLPVVYSVDYTPFLKYPISDKQLDLEEALIRLERNRVQNDASSTCSGHTSLRARSVCTFSTISERELSAEEELIKLKRQMKIVVDQKAYLEEILYLREVKCTELTQHLLLSAYLEEILHLREVKCTELTQQLLQWDEQAEKEKALSDSIIVELQGQLAEQQFRNRMLQEQMDRSTSNGFQEMEPVLARNRNSVSLHRSTEDPNKAVDVIAHMDRNGFCSRSSSDQSVKLSASDQSVRRSTETVITRTSSTSGSTSRPRAKSGYSKQKIAVAVEDILPSEKERLMFNVHKKLQTETFISFGDPDG
ncbi:RUN domain-containing protein 3A-like [Bolinopsis microptera]|uniref:RUN domain-containing protein 3A-like n=1 Tax=Bolinopsis microptera TaxID=2820187 RepID=UPI003078D71C